MFRLWHNPLDRSDAGTDLDREHIHDHKEHQFPPGTHDRVKASSGFIEALKGSKEAFNRVGRAGIGVAPQCRHEMVESLTGSRDPGVESTVLGRFFGFSARLSDLPWLEKLKLGFTNVQIMGATVIADPSITAGDLYLINTNHMKIKVLRMPTMKTIGDNPQTIPLHARPFMTDPKSLHSIGVMSLTLALCCSSCQRQGIATNCS